MKLRTGQDKNNLGFTLIELMIVVAIISILAAIAIPNFILYQLKAKTGEAKANMAAIRTCQETWAAENDVYIVCGPTPAANVSSVKMVWTTNTHFSSIGFEPAGDVYYSYGVNNAPVNTVAAQAIVTAADGTTVARPGLTNIWLNAMSDLDGDGLYAGFVVSNGTTTIIDLAPGEF
jgi:type IV pilus assembly protein PilA